LHSIVPYFMKSKEAKKGPAPEQWQPIKERSKTPDPRSEQETRFYFALMNKNNHRHTLGSFTIYPSIISTPEFIRYSYRNTVFLCFFLRDLKLSQPEVYHQYKSTIKTEYNNRKTRLIVLEGSLTFGDQWQRPAAPSVFTALSYFLGFSSVNSFYFFLESLYSLPYDKMMKGEGVKRGQPWYGLNYEEGTIQQGPNNEEEPPI
jgi:hypothetical protein